MTIQYSRPTLYAKQSLFVDDPCRFTFVEAGTKSGKTIAMIVWLHEQAISPGENKNYWWVAPYYVTAKIAFNRWRNFIPKETRHLFQKNESDLTITYPGSNNKIFFKSGEKPDALFGEDVHAFVIDEASRMREAAWNAIRSTVTATRGRGKIIGNVKGKKNWFYKNSQNAKNKGEGYYRLTSYDNPFLSRDEIDQARMMLPEKVFNELYLSEPTDDGSNPFGIDFIRSVVKPISLLPAACYGVDLAKSFDYTSITGLDVNGDVCVNERFQKDWAQTREHIIRVIGQRPTLIDSTGVGDPIVEDIQKKCNAAEGFKYTQSSKQQLMEGLVLAVQQKKTSVIAGVHQDEMESFEFEYTRTGVKYTAPSGMHDDTVNSHALAYSKFTANKNYGKYRVA